FASQSGVVLRAESLVSADGLQIVRLTARRGEPGRVVDVMLEVDEETGRPRMQTIRFSSPQRTVELRLAAERTEEFADAQLSAEMSEPDPGLMPAPVHVVRAPAIELPPPVPTMAQLADLEVDILHHLDQVGAVLGEQVTVKRRPEGLLQVRAVVDSEERK